ncbi:hypothetical protein TI39_contig4330g00006 [Zymoseptoria brevis]|uniref:Uncharacterized protein n=1 Tax=Zymoseptoria brevis TaxID=1047168 RepID=A0A0F4G7K5_9PEZI|nr:hypothetical protein TI39_contig4330g00006 [Zymoseptoria brevis]
MLGNKSQSWHTFPPYLAYKRLKALPKGTPCFETGEDGRPIVYYKETFCRMPGTDTSLPCGNSYSAPAALQRHLQNSHNVRRTEQWKQSQAWYNRLMRNHDSPDCDDGEPNAPQPLSALDRKTSSATVVDLGDDSEEERTEDESPVRLECAETEVKDNLQTRAARTCLSAGAVPTSHQRTSPVDTLCAGSTMRSPKIRLKTHSAASFNASPHRIGKRSASLAFDEEDGVTAVTKDLDEGEIQNVFHSNPEDDVEGDDAFHEQDGERLRQRLKEVRKQIQECEACELMYKFRAQRFGAELREMKLEHELATREF